LTARTPDYSKFTDFEISLLVAERDIAQYRVERLDQILSSVGQAKGFEDATKQEKTVKEDKKLDFDAEKLPWENIEAKENPKGPWQKTLKSADPNFLGLLAYINEKGTVRYQGSAQYWILNDGSIGRRTKKV
jgi:hypothetical protein